MRVSRVIIRRRFIPGRLFHGTCPKNHVIFSPDFTIAIEFLSVEYIWIINFIIKKITEGGGTRRS